MSASLNSLIPALRPYARALLQVAGANRLAPRVTSARRTTAEQARLYRAFLAGTQAYPVAPPGTSAHEYGYAFDMVTANGTGLAELGALWKSWGGVWGGEFNDPIHFEFPGFPKQQKAKPVTSAVGRAANKALGAYANLPWYVQLFLPIAGAVGEVPEGIKELRGDYDKPGIKGLFGP